MKSGELAGAAPLRELLRGETAEVADRSSLARMAEGQEAARAGMEVAAASWDEAGEPMCEIGGKLFRPVVAYAGVALAERPALDASFWCGALAVQMVHEASLLHDDIVDGADRRRGVASLHARSGVARALIEGDHLLTAAYRMALRTGSTRFVEVFIRAVERTVAGERAQGGLIGIRPTAEQYRDILRMKSGELFGCALSLGVLTHRDGAPGMSEEERLTAGDAAAALGTEIGIFYQKVDDFLDFCPTAASGKPPFQDYRQQKWTWPLAFSEITDFEEAPERAGELLFTAPSADMASPMRRAYDALLADMEQIEAEIALRFPEDRLLSALLRSWCLEAGNALANEEQWRTTSSTKGRRVATEAAEGATAPPEGGALPSQPASAVVLAEAIAVGDPSEQWAYFSKHSKTFRFASLLFPADAREVVAGLYAFCRFTDDLVDEGADLPVSEKEARLDSWLELTRGAYRGEPSGVLFLDELMRMTAARGISIHYAEELIAGVRMDLYPRHYPSLGALRVYTRRVASVVGQWMTELFGTPSSETLAGAEALGHAMQLTNILRDVGEDCRLGRIYLPLDRMAAHGLSPRILERMVRGYEEVTSQQREGYRALVEELMIEAEREYAMAFQAIPTLPLFFQRPVAVAARVYRGIHREIRRNHFDNLGIRAFTTTSRKVTLALGALLDLRKARAERARIQRAPLGLACRAEGVEA